MAIVRWRPMRDLFHIQEEMDRFMNNFFDRPGENDVRGGMWNPAVDISETEDSIIVSAEVPGMEKDDIKVAIHHNTLTIKGEKKKEKEVKDENYHRIERAYGSFLRSFALPATVDAGKVKASYKDGVLHIEVLKKDEAKAREIQISVE